MDAGRRRAVIRVDRGQRRVSIGGRVWGLGSATVNDDASDCGAKWNGTTARVETLDAIPADVVEQA